MSPREVEDVMVQFATKKIDVLIATTIIESGIDNPHSNTLIIEDSQRLGLAQLYQLKGRVGRSSTQAYAYFMFPGELPLTEEATARLTALSEFQDFGSGMRIAMRDLSEIRGAGSLVGAEQHGNLSSVGFDLFTQMLGQAVAEARGEGAGDVEQAIRGHQPAGGLLPVRGVRPGGRPSRSGVPQLAAADMLEAGRPAPGGVRGDVRCPAQRRRRTCSTARASASAPTGLALESVALIAREAHLPGRRRTQGRGVRSCGPSSARSPFPRRESSRSLPGGGGQRQRRRSRHQRRCGRRRHGPRAGGLGDSGSARSERRRRLRCL